MLLTPVLRAAADGLRDNPIAADLVTYLDGDAWTATMIAGGRCDFMADTDYDSGTEGPHIPVATKEDCCDACFTNTDDCAAAVFKDGQCWLKSGDQVNKPSSKSGRMACIKRVGETTGLTIPAKVPGDLISDLYAAGQIGNPFYELNWLNSSIWDKYAWTYSTTFEADEESLLVFDGIKMGATIKVNGVELGEATDQFLRYTFPLNQPDLLRIGANRLEVTFVGSSLQCHGRWMACSGGWDWAPYTDTTQEDAQTFTKGLWKSVYTARVGQAAIEHFVPHVFYKGAQEHPTSPLEDGKHAGFELRARVHLMAATATTGTLTVAGAWGGRKTQKVDVPAGGSNVTVSIDVLAADVKLWWPFGLGAQELYNVTASFSGANLSVIATRRIGFRHVALVTGNDTDAGYIEKAATEEGSDSHGLLFRVNGAAIMTKGANMIPMEELEGWMDADAHRVVVQSTVEANMNTLRVWGGGMFLPDAWYDACDELGVLVYHDMMYAQQGHAPTGSQLEELELRHMVRRLSHHASIMVWDGCNECQVIMHTETAIYATFVMTVVAEEDASRAVWPSCPAIGWSTGVHKLTGMPNGNALTTPDDGRHFDTHGPYKGGSGFPAVNGNPQLNLFSANIPLNITAGDTGLSFQSVFASEFGATVMSSFESMAPTLAPEHWALHAGQPSDTCSGGFGKECEGPNVMAQRNYPCDSFIFVYFGHRGQDLNATGEVNFKQQLYQCMIGQALEIKQNIETRMSQNTFGILVWQLNEIWPTGGWGSIEYGNPNFPGQVIGGRWKPLHYWYRNSIFADVMVTCGQDGQCYVRNDSPWAFEGNLTLRSTRFADAQVSVLLERTLSLPAGAGVVQWFQSDEVAALSGLSSAVEGIVTNAAGAIVSSNLIALATPESMQLSQATVAVSASLEDGAIVASLTTDAVAMYVTLTTLAHGHFEDNAFMLLPPGRKVKFFLATPSPHGSTEEAFESFKQSLRVEDVSLYQQPTAVGELIV